ncbi:peptidoglycan-binding domain-containing protein [Streptomyces cavernae]|uniref:peptidoglycan-binding domain-containing protein n=1 Tax=Streptomyces cavernae TaxID=2259034 RepID=UPI0012D9EE2F|nr:peptidoglycan-binding domain-containing protein [Streptomyces cavernae]
MPLAPVPDASRDEFLFGAPAPPETRPIPGADTPDPGLDPVYAEYPEHPQSSSSKSSKRSGRRLALLGTAGAAVIVVVSAWFANALLSFDPPTDDHALPKDVRASAPTTTPATSASPAAPSTTPPEPTPTTPAPSAPARSEPTRPAAPHPTTAAPSTSKASTPSEPSPTPTPTADESSSGQDRSDPPLLGPGDTGEEVVELQERLRSINFFLGEANGEYGFPTEDAVRRYQLSRDLDVTEPGVYDRVTRKSLESETQEP